MMCAHGQQARYCAQYPAAQLLGWERVCELVFNAQRPSHPPGGAKSAAAPDTFFFSCLVEADLPAVLFLCGLNWRKLQSGKLQMFVCYLAFGMILDKSAMND